GDFEPDRHKTGDDKKSIASFTIVAPGSAGLDAAITRGRVIGESTNFARDMINEPGNLLTPVKMAEAARAMAAGQGLECEVLDRDAMEKLGMGSLLGVSIGSAEPPAFIVLRYRPATVHGH